MNNLHFFIGFVVALLVAAFMIYQHLKVYSLKIDLKEAESDKEFLNSEILALTKKNDLEKEKFAVGLRNLSKAFFKKTNKHLFDKGFQLNGIIILDINLIENYQKSQKVSNIMKHLLFGLGINAEDLYKHLFKNVEFLSNCNHSHWWQYKVWSIKDNCEIRLSERHLAYLFSLKPNELPNYLLEPIQIPEDFEFKNNVYPNEDLEENIKTNPDEFTKIAIEEFEKLKANPKEIFEESLPDHFKNSICDTVKEMNVVDHEDLNQEFKKSDEGKVEYKPTDNTNNPKNLDPNNPKQN